MTLHVSRRGLFGAGAGLFALAGGAGSQLPPSAAAGEATMVGALPMSARAPFASLPRTKVLFGAWEPGPPEAMDAVEAALGRRMDIVHWYQGWGVEDPSFDAERAAAVIARGGLPMVTWEPWDYRAGRVQPRFRMRRIANGAFDDYIRSWGRALKELDAPVLLRFAHEMNGRAYPWSIGVNGTTGKQYVRAWRRVARILRAEGAHRVSLVWCPLVPSPNSAPLRRCFPGDRYVDVLGMDGYNAGTAADWGGWLSFQKVFGPLYSQLRRLSDRPMIIAETGCAESGGDKARWIQRAFRRQLPKRFPRVRAVVWFNEPREANWRLDSTPRSLRAARETFTSGRFG